MTIKTWNIEEMTGYKPQTTFYEDFSIADRFGIRAVKDTFRRAKAAWQDNVVYFTELVMALNWKIWEHYGHNDTLAKVYNDLWGEADLFAQGHFKGDDLAYFYRTTD